MQEQRKSRPCYESHQNPGLAQGFVLRLRFERTRRFGSLASAGKRAYYPQLVHRLPQTPFGSMDRGKNADIRRFKKIIAPLDETGVGVLTA